jgi:class 3 adenylate cyclase
MPAEVQDTVPASRAALKLLRDSFEVEVVAWPWIRGGPEFPSTWQGSLQAIVTCLKGGDHILVVAGNAAQALAAVSIARAGIRSFACDGIALPPATLRALGLGALADAVAAAIQVDKPALLTSIQSARHLMQGAGEEKISELAAVMAKKANWAKLDEFYYSWIETDITSEAIQLTAPVLYLDPPVQWPGWGDMADIFRRFVPHAEVEELKHWPMHLHDPEAGVELAEKVIAFIRRVAAGTALATVMVTDIVDSTPRAVELGSQRWGGLLTNHNALVRRELERCGGHEVDTAGDGFLASFDSPTRAVECAGAITQGVRALDLEVRVGIHTGECEKLGDKLAGAAVHVAARLAAQAAAGEVLVSEAVRQLLIGSAIELEERGEHELKGLPGEWRLFAARRSEQS